MLQGIPMPEHEIEYIKSSQEAMKRFKMNQMGPNAKPIYKYDSNYTTPQKGKTTIYVDSITTAIKELNEKGSVSPQGKKDARSLERLSVTDGDLLCSPRGCARVVISSYNGGGRNRKRKRSKRSRKRSRKRTRKRSRKRSRKRTMKRRSHRRRTK